MPNKRPRLFFKCIMKLYSGFPWKLNERHGCCYGNSWYNLPLMQLYSNLRYFTKISKQFSLAFSRSSMATAKLHSRRPEHHLSSSGRTSLLHPRKSSAFRIQRPTDIRPYSADVTNIISSLAQDICTCSEIQTSITSVNKLNEAYSWVLIINWN